MPITLPAALASHLAGESLTLATLWRIVRVDGEVYHYTDHDRDIDYAGNTYKTGVGYDRTAIEDKADLSPDNLNIQGIIVSDEISKEDIRAGMFDGAEVWIYIVNWANIGGGAIVRRRGWLGEVKQNNLGQFDTELRGLSEALSETLSRVYTPGCVADLGDMSTAVTALPCGRALTPALRLDNTRYETGQEISIAGIDDLVFRATKIGITSSNPYDEDFDYALIGDLIEDGQQVWQAFEAWRIPVTINNLITPSRRVFSIDVSSARLDDDPTHFDGGLITFLTGANATYSREIKFLNVDSNGVECQLYLRMPFEVADGDTAYLFPGCDKRIETCRDKFANSINFKGFPHIPGDDYLTNYPDAKQ